MRDYPLVVLAWKYLRGIRRRVKLRRNNSQVLVTCLHALLLVSERSRRGAVKTSYPGRYVGKPTLDVGMRSRGEAVRAIGS